MRIAGSTTQRLVLYTTHVGLALKGLKIEEGGEAILNGGVDETVLNRLIPSVPLDVER